jgi:hypothetical protein
MPPMHRNALRIPISHGTQKHEFHITCPDALFMNTAPVPPKYENTESMFRTPDASEWTI